MHLHLRSDPTYFVIPFFQLSPFNFAKFIILGILPFYPPPLVLYYFKTSRVFYPLKWVLHPSLGTPIINGLGKHSHLLSSLLFCKLYAQSHNVGMSCAHDHAHVPHLMMKLKYFESQW
jgi:hypothetical protein